MKVLNVHEAKTKLSSLLAEIEQHGEEVLICRNGKPIADLVPHRMRDRLAPHPVMSALVLKYDPLEPLSAEEWPDASR